MRLVKLIANLGYGSRKQVMELFREGLITDAPAMCCTPMTSASMPTSASTARRWTRRRG